METRLGDLSNRLSESVGKERLNLTEMSPLPTDGPSPLDSTPGQLKTPWLEIDDVFYESRGAAWALLHLLKAVEIDFQDVLRNKGAAPSLRQIIIELEATQQGLWSPMVLNGDGFGLLANHSLIMASYLSRANAAMSDLRALLSQG